VQYDNFVETPVQNLGQREIDRKTLKMPINDTGLFSWREQFLS
jgi:hypothetical protein